MGTGVEGAVIPAVAPVEFGDQREPTIGGSIQMAGEFSDLRLEFVQFEVLRNGD